jgi:TRAP transporter TAXI family solute receptor
MKKTILVCALIATLSIGVGMASAKTYVTIATGGTGGTFYSVGAAMAKVLNSKVKDISVSAESTGASVANCRLLGAKKVEFGLVATDALYAAYFGKREFKEPIKNLRLLLVGYSAPFHVLVGANSGISSIKELKGKRVASYPGSTSEFQVPAILSVYGITRKDYTTVPLLPSEQVQAYRDGSVDCIFTTLGVPNSSITDLTTTHKMRFLPIEGQYADKAVKEYPFFPEDVIKAGTYKGLDHDVQTLATRIVIVTRKDVSDKLITTFMNVISGNLVELRQIHKAAASFTPEMIKNSIYIPLHPAAEKWYKQKGLVSDVSPLWKK